MQREWPAVMKGNNSFMYTLCWRPAAHYSCTDSLITRGVLGDTFWYFLRASEVSNKPDWIVLNANRWVICVDGIVFCLKFS